jgi:type I restriction system adenine methylase HsdM
MKQNGSIRITQNELEDYLWGAAVLLRGLIDAGDYKGYIFPLLFLKRISDVWQEERVLALNIYSDDESVAGLAENHRFAIPDGAHWSDIRSTTTDVGSKILSCMRQIEAANPESLTGVFGDSDWTNRNLLSDEVLSNLIEHFSSEELSLARLPEDELGNGYEFLIRKFADDSGHTAQEFYTNRTLVHLMTRMLKPAPGESVYDPTCGTGGMLISCADEVRRKGEDHRTLRLFGQELNYTTASIAKMNLFLHGIEDASIAHGDTLSKPMFTSDAGKLKTFDVVLANPPYSIKNWNRQIFAKDPFGRNLWGVPPQGRADYVFFQHIAKSMDPDSGRAVVLFPHGVLFRIEERELRKNLLNSGLLESVIGLGPGLFYNSPMEAVLVTLRSKRPKDKEKKALFINAVELVARERSNAYLNESHQKTILDAYSNLDSVPGLSKLVDYSEIVENEYSLAIPLYVSPMNESVFQMPTDISETIDTWKQSNASVTDVLANLILELEEYVNHDN